MWSNRDPIQEFGGIKLYAFVLNDLVDLIDCRGLDDGACAKCESDFESCLLRWIVHIGLERWWKNCAFFVIIALGFGLRTGIKAWHQNEQDYMESSCVSAHN
jgi:hypothetical protein